MEGRYFLLICTALLCLDFRFLLKNSLTKNLAEKINYCLQMLQKKHKKFMYKIYTVPQMKSGFWKQSKSLVFCI